MTAANIPKTSPGAFTSPWHAPKTTDLVRDVLHRSLSLLFYEFELARQELRPAAHVVRRLAILVGFAAIFLGIAITFGFLALALFLQTWLSSLAATVITALIALACAIQILRATLAVVREQPPIFAATRAAVRNHREILMRELS